jgi:hypothetical protein
MPPPALRVIEVLPPSVGAETWGVVRAALAVGLVASFVIFSPHGDATTAAAGPALMPYQRLFVNLPATDQRIVRSLREGMVEAENVRGTTKQWPDVAALAREGIPPFADDPVDREGYVWTRVQQGLVINYRGVPRAASAQSEYLMLFVEPDPGALRMPGERAPPVDEQHHTLSDGTALHASIWMRPRREAATGDTVGFPANDGWTQVLAKPVDAAL